MNRSAALLAFLIWPGVALAQTDNQKEAPLPKVTKVIRIHYASPKTVADLVGGGGSVVVMGDKA